VRPRRPHPRRRRRRERAYLLDVTRGHDSLSESSNRALSVLVLTHNHLRRRHPSIPFVSRRTRRVAFVVALVVVIVITELAGGRRVSRELARTSAWNAPLNAKRWENPPRMNAIVRACVCPLRARVCGGRDAGAPTRHRVHSGPRWVDDDRRVW